MERRIFTQEEFTKIAPTFERDGVQFYLLRVNPQQIEEGKVAAVEELFDHEPNEADEKALYDAWLAMEKRVKVDAITKYDVSENVNVFELNGMRAWLDKATRVGLVNSLSIEKESGRTESTLFLNGIALVLPIDDALAMLNTLELYAIDCYRQTEAHKLAVNALAVIEDVQNYDISAGYPAHPVFEV